MLKVRVIPCLDVKDGRVVKGVQFVNLVDAGDPVEQAQAYDAAGADELMFLDITASHENRGIILDVVARTADVCFMPLSVGGGIRSVEDGRRLLLAGADKISVMTAAVNDRDVVSRCADAFGSQAVVVSVDAKRTASRSWSRWTRRRQATAGRSSPTGAAIKPASTRSSTPSKWWQRAPAKSCSPPWTATAPRSATTWTSSAPSAPRCPCP